VAQLRPAAVTRLTERSAAQAWQRTSLLLSLSFRFPSIAFPITPPTSHFPLHSTTCNLHFAHLLLCAQASTRARDNWPSPSCLVPCLNTSRRQPSRARCITSAHPLCPPTRHHRHPPCLNHAWTSLSSRSSARGSSPLARAAAVVAPMPAALLLPPLLLAVSRRPPGRPSSPARPLLLALPPLVVRARS
jgi:hypothetical protein